MQPFKIAIVTDAWYPQVNGVVVTLNKTRECLVEAGHNVKMFTPEGFRTMPCPTYPEIRLSLFAGKKLQKQISDFQPDSIHIATEGPLGISARAYCKKNGVAFTTSYHTQFPQYVRARVPIPLSVSYAFLRWFHGDAVRTLVPTNNQKQDLLDHGFERVVVWDRGVDTNLFQPGSKDLLSYPRPIWVYLGRVAAEKNIDAFLELDLPGTKCVIGDGPALAKIRKSHIDTILLGYQFGEELAQTLAACDVFVFPSRTDTFGLVMLEAMACGLPVAAYPVTGPIDVVKHGVTGILDEDLGRACRAAIRLDPKDCREEALTRTWAKSSEKFLQYLACSQNGQDLVKSKYPTDLSP